MYGIDNTKTFQAN